MIELMNNTFYLVLTIILYTSVIVYAALKISPKLRGLISSQTGLNNSLKKAGEILENTITKPLGKLFRNIIAAENAAGNIFRKAETIFTDKIIPALTEPVNIASLLIRKAYNENIQATVTFAAFLFVAFYIILSIL